MLTNKTSQAIDYFKSGYNCAQSVLLPFANELKADKNTLEKISLGFGGGMGRLQKTCGVVTGAFMVIGLYCSTLAEEERGKRSRLMIQEFHSRFINIHGVSDCRDLLDCDRNTAQGQSKFKENGLKEKVCVPCTKNAVNILETLLAEKIIK